MKRGERLETKLEGRERREQILQMLESTDTALSGTAIAKRLGVSRQIIVQDIALLRASNKDILSTPRGYQLFRQSRPGTSRRFRVFHTDQQMEPELNAMIDAGGRVLDVIVEHPIYGEICASLPLSSRKDIQDFLQKIRSQKGTPLMEIANGVHMHTVEADNRQILDEIEQTLRAAHILWEPKN